jgi:archaellum component FlaF (FlaF/FlaG flagellin family)
MSIHTQREAASDYRGMKRSTRISVIAGVAVFLTLVSGVSFAAWTASSTKTATASAGTIAVTTATSGGAATITALGPYTYTAANQTITKPITVRNTGSVAATLSQITITRSGTLAGDKVDLKFWVGSSSACAASSAVVSAKLSDASVSFTSQFLTIPASSSAILCASTTFNGSMTTEAGTTSTATFALRTAAGSNWVADDVLSSANRTFTQQIDKPSTPPTAATCTPSNSNGEPITISWTAPAGFTVGYRLYWNGSRLNETAFTGTSVQVLNQAATAPTLATDPSKTGNGGSNTGYLTVRAVASNGFESVDSAQIPITPRQGNAGIQCGS